MRPTLSTLALLCCAVLAMARCGQTAATASQSAGPVAASDASQAPADGLADSADLPIEDADVAEVELPAQVSRVAADAGAAEADAADLPDTQVVGPVDALAPSDAAELADVQVVEPADAFVPGDVVAPADLAPAQDAPAPVDVPPPTCAQGAACDDGNACSKGDSCQNGACKAGPAVDCNDGNPCTDDSCAAASGCLHKGNSAPCSDGNACNGADKCNPATAKCQAAPLVCPQAPPECNQSGGAQAPTASLVKEIPATGFRLADQNTWDANTAIIKQIAVHWSVKPAPIAAVAADLNRVASKISKLTDLPCLQTGFEWESGDQDVKYWIPQGIAGSATATPDGAWAGKKLLLVSWYHDKALDAAGSPDKGVRVAVVDVTNMAAIKYRLVLLVEPYMASGVASFKPVSLHAGGIAWRGNYLYVADTSTGVRVFDVQQMLQVQTGKGDSVGKVSEAAGYHAFNYKYVLPQVGRYALCGGACCARFSFAELDLSSSPVSLVMGEYSVDTLLGRVHRWPLEPSTNRLAAPGGVVQASQAFFPGVVKMQGAQMWNGHLYVSSSAAKKTGTTSAGSLFHAAIGGAIQTLSWPHHPEDFHYAAASDNLWSLTEDAGERAVFAVKMASMAAGCGK